MKTEESMVIIALLLAIGLRWLWKMRRGRRMPKDRLSRPIVHLGRNDVLTLRDVCQSVLFLGSTGSGKTSSARTFIGAYLHEGFGGLVLLAKDDRQLWIEEAREAGREDDLVFVGPHDEGEAHCFNPLDYEATRQGRGGGHSELILNLLMTLLEVARRVGGSVAREGESFWLETKEQLIRAAIDLALLAKGRVTLHDLYLVIISAPTSLAQVGDAEWQQDSVCYGWLCDADKQATTASERHTLSMVADYFLKQFPQLGDKTQATIVTSFTAMIDVLDRGILKDMFGGESTMTPDVIWEEGKIVIVALDVKAFGQLAVYANCIWKYCFQQAVERRDLANPRPVFLWADEAHFFLTSKDSLFQTTCRSAHVSNVLLTQSLGNIYAALGGNDRARVETDNLLANINTTIFCANGDPVTNEWAAKLIGREVQYLGSGGSSSPAESPLLHSDRSSINAGFSEAWEWQIQPHFFATELCTGGPPHWTVDTIVHRSGRRFQSTGRSWMPVSFRQKV